MIDRMLLERPGVELKLAQLVGHTRKGYKQEAARTLGVDTSTISRNLENPSEGFLRKLNRALELSGIIDSEEVANENAKRAERERLTALAAALETYRNNLDEAGRQAFDTGVTYAQTRAKLNH